MKIIVGITGGIACGKSHISNFIRTLGYTVIDCDQISRKILEKNSVGFNRVVDEFSADILDDNVNIDRTILGKLVFNNNSLREKLNSIIHPLVKENVVKEISLAKGKIIFIDVPLLFESGFDDLCDLVICADLDYDTQVERLMERDNISLDYAVKKISCQMPTKEKCEKSDFIVSTKGSMKETEGIVLNCIKAIEGGTLHGNDFRNNRKKY